MVFSLREAEEAKPAKEKQEGKEKSSTSRRGNRYHPYKDKHGGGGEKKGAHRNRVFISNIPYDMKWQAIKDLMREKGNVPSGCRGVGACGGSACSDQDPPRCSGAETPSARPRCQVYDLKSDSMNLKGP